MKFKGIINICLLFISVTFYSCQELHADISVDFKKKRELNSLVGFLHFNDIKKHEKDLKELKPKYWRFRYRDNAIDAVNVLLQNNVKPIIVISDKYGYPDDPKWKTPLGSSKYVDIVKDIYLKLGNKVIYDPWNEPYMKGFGGFSSKEFYEIFKQAHNMIRSLPGGDNALITGPSFEQLKRSEMEDFFKFCEKNKIKVDILSWHEWRNEADLKDVSKDIEWVKKTLLPKYSKVGVKKIVLTEIIHANIQFSPTMVYKVYQVLENNNIDGGCRGCFLEENGVVNCENNSVTGLLDNNGRTRSIWWATKFYSQSVTNRVESKSNLDDLISFASYDQSKGYLLLANNYKKSIKEVKIKMSIKGLPFFTNVNKLKLSIYKIPDSGKNVLQNPIFVSSNIMKNDNDFLNINLRNFSEHEVLYLVISK